MLNFHKWNCSWSMVAIISSLVALVSLVHMFLYPLVPASLDYFGARQARSSCYPINGLYEGGNGLLANNSWPIFDLDARFPADSNQAVSYQGAPWKAEIGRWFSGCDSIVTEIDIIERIGAKACKNGCSGQGICNHELGECRCFHGYAGESCSEKLQLDCNFPGSPELPYGRWVVSTCPAHCDTTRAMCFCGEGTRYPNRPVAEACGFQMKLPSEPGGPKLPDWSKADLENIFTTNSSNSGWCNVDPNEAYTSKVKFKDECDCKYDGLWGTFCEVPSLCSCINQCSGRGHCRGGFCQCDGGWYGIDCNIPSIWSSIREWPRWLRPATVSLPDNVHPTGDVLNVNALVKKKRPLIYVYDLPPEFNSHLLEGRHFKFQCVNRIYSDRNMTLWTNQLYGSQVSSDDTFDDSIRVLLRPQLQKHAAAAYAPMHQIGPMGRRPSPKFGCFIKQSQSICRKNQWFEREPSRMPFMALYESILASPHRTLNGDEADYFYVPVLDSCLITRADNAPHLSTREHMGLRSLLTLDYYKRAYLHIVEHYPYWNRSSGRDHIWLFSWDEGACYAPKEIWNSMMLVHWGNTNSKHKNSTTAYWADNWDRIPSDKRGDHPCFDPEKDLVIPAWKHPDPDSLRLKLWARSRKERTRLFYFNGNLGSAYENGRPEDTYSMGIRQKLAREFGSIPDKYGKLGRQYAENVLVTPKRSDNYYEELANSTFCGVLPGDGWSGRMEDSILQGCIPVVVQDGIFLPYENVLNYESFSVRVREDEIPNLLQILQQFNETEIEFMLENVRKIWQRFLYRDSVLLEAERQKTSSGQVYEWGTEFLKLGEDDVFSTFIQVLHYKLHNDPWRKQLNFRQKEFGLPRACLRNSN